MSEEQTVDPWRFAGTFLKRVLSANIPEQPAYDSIPWAPLSKPLAEVKVALLSTAGISETIEANHLHIDTGYIERDLNVALPLDRLRELVEQGVVGSMADTHYSTMGFQGNDSSQLMNETAPAIGAAMKSEEVDLAILAPV